MPEKEHETEKKQKDVWDKVEIISKFSAAILIVGFGFIANDYLQKKREDRQRHKIVYSTPERKGNRRKLASKGYV